ncbi:MAG: hypothetical protein IPP77_09315 [Bacteroidetes bacterium]|nr:hypothetical protein [Bacteroidota bacterium]
MMFIKSSAFRPKQIIISSNYSCKFEPPSKNQKQGSALAAQMNRERRIFLLSIVLCLLSCWSVQAQVNVERFGQNRIQYKNYTFSYYESDHFVTHFYQGGQDVAKYVIKTAEDNLDEISKMFDFGYSKRVDIIVYNNISELNQTNIGIYEPEQSPGGTIKLPDNKIFIYFNGDHGNLRSQVRQNITRIFLDKMERGTNFGEAIQNAVLLNLPDWYKIGLERYVGDGWTSELEDRLRDGIMSGRFKKLNRLPREESVLVGQSMWHYIEEVHGKTALANILYLTRVNHNVDNGFLFVLGEDMEITFQKWYEYYVRRFEEEERKTVMPPDSTIVKAKIRKSKSYYQARLCPDGKHIAYCSNDMGRYKVHLLNTENGKKKVVLRGGFRTNTLFTDESAPLLAWDPSGKRLAIIRDKKDKTDLFFYEMEKKKKARNPVRKFQKVLSFGFVDSKQLVMSAVQNGQTDIFLYTIASTTTQKLTDDFYDDLQPAYIEAGGLRGIMFSSNRESDTLRPQRYESQVIIPQYNLFFYDLDAAKDVLYPVTSNPLTRESYPQNFSADDFCFLSDANGIENRRIGHFEKVFDHFEKTYYYTLNETGDKDSVSLRDHIAFESVIDKSVGRLYDSSRTEVYKISGVTAPATNYTYQIREQSVVPEKGMALDMFQQKGKVQFRKYLMQDMQVTTKPPMMDYMTKLQQGSVAAVPEKKKEEVKPVAEQNDTSITAKGNRPFDLQSEFDFGIKLFDWDSVAAAQLNAAEEGYVFRFSRVRPYFVRFSTDKVITSFDNNLIVTRYQPFTGFYTTSPLPIFGIKMGITDLLENYKIYGGVRLPFDKGFKNMEYFITYENLKRRLDKKFTVYHGARSTDVQVSDDITGRSSNTELSIKTTYIEMELKYPFNVLQALKLNLSFRNDNMVFKAIDDFTLQIPSMTDNWLSLRTEYVFDNCIEVMSNIRYGTRFKVFAEVQKQFPTKDKNISDGFDIPLVQFNKTVLGLVGFDLRHYQKIYRQIIWANRLTAGASFGSAKMMYYMGGLDNWFTLPSISAPLGRAPLLLPKAIHCLRRVFRIGHSSLRSL